MPLAIFVGFSAHADPVETTLEPPYAGVQHYLREDSTIPYRAHILEIELTSVELTLVATAASDRGRTTTAWAVAEGVHIAVNGDLFDPFSFRPRGLAFGGGNTWDDTADDAVAVALRFDQAMGVNHAVIDPPDMILDSLTPETTGVVSGRPILLEGGAVASLFDDDPLIFPYDRGPRTAVGLSEDGRKMYLVVADGWQGPSLGMTLEEVANVLASHGAFRAVALDSGSSSTLYVRSEGGLVNAPSDGVERAVANHLGISFTARPPGEMRGLVCANELCPPQGAGEPIAGATVTLDSGQVEVSAANGFFSFANITPRYTCATADIDGYHPGTGCSTIPSGSFIYSSIVLYPDSMFIDGGPEPPDAAVADARPRPDSASAGDGGNPFTDGGTLGPPQSSCVCRAAAARPPRSLGLGSLLLGACVLVAIRAMLRRA